MTNDELRKIPIILTTHAIDRIKERFNLNKKVAKSLVTKALANGDISYQRLNNGIPDSISISHHDKLFKLVIKSDHLLCTTAHPHGTDKKDYSVHIKGNVTKPKRGLSMKRLLNKKPSKFKPKGNN